MLLPWKQSLWEFNTYRTKVAGEHSSDGGPVDNNIVSNGPPRHDTVTKGWILKVRCITITMSTLTLVYPPQ